MEKCGWRQSKEMAGPRDAIVVDPEESLAARRARLLKAETNKRRAEARGMTKAGASW